MTGAPPLPPKPPAHLRHQQQEPALQPSTVTGFVERPRTNDHPIGPRQPFLEQTRSYVQGYHHPNRQLLPQAPPIPQKIPCHPSVQSQNAQLHLANRTHLQNNAHYLDTASIARISSPHSSTRAPDTHRLPQIPVDSGSNDIIDAYADSEDENDSVYRQTSQRSQFSHVQRNTSTITTNTQYTAESDYYEQPRKRLSFDYNDEENDFIADVRAALDSIEVPRYEPDMYFYDDEDEYMGSTAPPMAARNQYGGSLRTPGYGPPPPLNHLNSSPYPDRIDMPVPHNEYYPSEPAFPGLPRASAEQLMGPTAPLSLGQPYPSHHRTLSVPSSRAPESLQSSLQSTLHPSHDLPVVPTAQQALNLPSIPDALAFDVAKLSSREYASCDAIWSFSSVAQWITHIFADNLAEIAEEDALRALQGLFSHFIPAFGWVQAERAASQLISSFKSQYFFVQSSLPDAQKVTFAINVDADVSGVLPVLTGSGCYSPRNHDLSDHLSYRCYSPKCSRTLPLRANNLQETGGKVKVSEEDWAKYYNIPEEALAEIPKQEKKRQYAIHELIRSEELFCRDLSTYMEAVGSPLLRMSPPVIAKQQEFYNLLFKPMDDVLKLNSAHLLAEFKERQKTQGPFVQSIADIILSWVKLAKNAVIAYAETYNIAERRLKHEVASNERFNMWFQQVCGNLRSVKGYSHEHYFNRIIPRIARYHLQLGAILHNTPDSLDEHAILKRAMEECSQLTGACDRRIEIAQRQIELANLKEHIIFKEEAFSMKVSELNLGDRHRKIFRQGNVTRKGEYRMDWVDTHVVLLDNYLILAKKRKGVYGDKLFVTKPPIPLDLLVVEQIDHEPVAKSSKLGVGAFTSNVATSPDNSRRTNSKSGDIGAATPIRPPTQNSFSSSSSTPTITALQQDNKELLYPFKLKHLGINGATYTLFSRSRQDRDVWADNIIAAKREWSQNAYLKNLEPFRLKVLNNTAFGYGAGEIPRLPVFSSQGTALDRALEPTRATSYSLPLIKSKVNCASSFVFADGVEYTLLGLDGGIFIFDGSSQQWRKAQTDVTRITVIDVIVEFNLLCVLADKMVVHYGLDAVLSPSASKDRVQGMRLNKNNDVGFFKIAKVKDRCLLFYKRRDGLNSIFKVLEPVKEKGKQTKRSFITLKPQARVASTSYFREVDKFYIPTESFGISLFNVSFAIHSARGFEVMSLDVKQPVSIPLVESIGPAVAGPINKAFVNTGKKMSGEAFRKRLEASLPVGAFRLEDSRLVLVYEEFALFSDNHGEMLNNAVIYFISKIESAAVQYPFLITFSSELVEIRRLDRDGGPVVQVIVGKDIRSLDLKDGQIKIAMAHPEINDRQLIVDLVTNKFRMEGQ